MYIFLLFFFLGKCLNAYLYRILDEMSVIVFELFDFFSATHTALSSQFGCRKKNHSFSDRDGFKTNQFWNLVFFSFIYSFLVNLNDQKNWRPLMVASRYLLQFSMQNSIVYSFAKCQNKKFQTIQYEATTYDVIHSCSIIIPGNLFLKT